MTRIVNLHSPSAVAVHNVSVLGHIWLHTATTTTSSEKLPPTEHIYKVVHKLCPLLSHTSTCSSTTTTTTWALLLSLPLTLSQTLTLRQAVKLNSEASLGNNGSRQAQRGLTTNPLQPLKQAESQLFDSPNNNRPSLHSPQECPEPLRTPTCGSCESEMRDRSRAVRQQLKDRTQWFQAVQQARAFQKQARETCDIRFCGPLAVAALQGDKQLWVIVADQFPPFKTRV